MNPPARAFSAYRQAETSTLSQRELIVKLYQGCERFLNLAIAGIHNDQLDQATINVQKARRIIVELLSTLNFEVGGEIAVQLKELYLFIVHEMTEAGLERDAARLQKLLPIIATLRSAWQEVPDTFANLSSLPEQHQGHSLNIRT